MSSIVGKRYGEMDQEYRDKFSRDEFRGQKERKQYKQYKKGRMAGDKVIPQASFMGDPSEVKAKDITKQAKTENT